MKKLDKKSTHDRIIIDLEAMKFKCMKVVGMYNYLERKKELKMHIHENMIEICFLEKGAQYYQVKGKDYYMKGGDILIVYPGEKHGTQSYHEEKGKLFWLILTLPKGNKHLLNLSKQESNYIIEQIESFKNSRLIRGKSPIAGVLNKIFRTYKESDSIIKRVRITNLLTSFLILVVEYGNKTDKLKVSQEFLQLSGYIDDNPGEELLLEKLAERVNLSLSHFKYRFKKEMGFSPGDYILRSKIEHAKTLLNEENTVADVAYSLNFSSPSYFATIFKRYTGTTPTSFVTQ